jgi:YD repeat-containing protein
MVKTALKILIGLACAISRLTFAETVTATFNYDLAGRLTNATYHTVGKAITYTYDRAGNMLTNAVTSVPIFADTDGDGMDDAWEIQYFGNLTHNGLGDSDGDGLNDFAEFIAGTNPTNSASVFRVTQFATSGQTNALITWSSVSGKTYRVQFKNALTNPVWINLAGDITAAAATTSKTETNLSGQASRFYRVLVVP